MAIEELNKLKELDFNKQIAFAYLTCERVFPNCIYFSENYHFGNTTILREAIDFVYNSIFLEANIDKQKIEYFLTMIYQNTPNTNDFATFYATIAMYSGGVIYESVNLLKKTGIEKILSDIATMSTDAIDCFIQERDDMDYEDEGFEEKILNDTLMQTEIALQKGIISYLSKIDKIEVSDIDTLIQMQKNNIKGTLSF
jgi:uncharacterized protein YjaG (DUF416 family)